MKRGDWVTTRYGGRGIVLRVARDGSWADVRFWHGDDAWSKRMPVASLIVQTEIDVAGVTVQEVES